MLRLALPVLAEQVLHMLVGFSDTILAGQYLGKAELAAMGMMNYILWLVFTLFGFVAIGSTALIARLTGGGDHSQAGRATHQSLLLGGVWSVILVAAGWLCADGLVGLLQMEGETARLAARYVRAVSLILPAIMITEIGIACFRGVGDTITGLLAMAIVNIINVALSWSLVLGWGPFPKLGWDGLIVGTLCGHVVGSAIILAALLAGRSGLKLKLRHFRADRAMIRRLLRIGIPGGAETMAVVVCHMWYVSIINHMGDLATAAHGVGVRIESLAYLPGFAFQVAATTLVGQYLGAGDPRRASRSVITTCLVGGGVMTFAGVLMVSMPRTLARLFVRADQTDVIELIATLLPIVSLSMPALALVSILGGALRGAGDTRWPLGFTLAGLLLVRIPGAYFLAYESISVPLLGITVEGWGYGVVGAWLAMVADTMVRCLLVVFRFRHGGWKRVKV